MKKHQKEIIKLTSNELFLSFFDLFISTQKVSPVYGFRRPVYKYLEERRRERANVFQKIRYWQRQGYINSFIEGKEKYIELTNKGKKHLSRLSLIKIKIKRPKKWDSKWRLVIFDIPEKQKHQRNVMRCKLKTLGFYRIQKSVYVYPFECTKEITGISERLYITKYVLIMISEIIQGEAKIINRYLKLGILKRSDLINK